MSGVDFLDKLLDGVEVEWTALGSLARIGTGSSNRQDESENGIYPFYVRSKSILKSDTFEFDEEAIVIPGEGGIGDIFHYAKGKYALHQRAYRICISSELISTKFLYHFMLSSCKQYILMKSVGATARRYITASLKREFASDNGTELNAVLPRMSPLSPQYLIKKQNVFQQIAAFVEKFKGVGGQV